MAAIMLFVALLTAGGAVGECTVARTYSQVAGFTELNDSTYLPPGARVIQRGTLREWFPTTGIATDHAEAVLVPVRLSQRGSYRVTVFRKVRGLWYTKDPIVFFELSGICIHEPGLVGGLSGTPAVVDFGGIVMGVASLSFE